MRHLLLLLLIVIMTTAIGRAMADDAVSGMQDGLRQQARPLLYALSLLGTPYKSGGTDPAKGTDCSGFVKHVYKESMGIELPHNARAMSERNPPIEQDQLQPGDLVFFNTRKKAFSHVGIYAGDGKFIHSASQRAKRVELSDLNQRYWMQRYDGARRVMAAQ